MRLAQRELDGLRGSGVSDHRVSSIGRMATVSYDAAALSKLDIVAALNKVHLGASLMEDAQEGAGGETSAAGRACKIVAVEPASLIAVAQTLLWAVALVPLPGIGDDAAATVRLWALRLIVAAGVVPTALKRLRQCFTGGFHCAIDVEVLMLTAACGALGLGRLQDAARLLWIYSAAQVLQRSALAYAHECVTGCIAGAPVQVRATDGRVMPLSDVVVGSELAVRGGESIPADGVVAKGSAAVDESSVSGEWMPKRKRKGDRVLAGTLVQSGFLEITATAAPGDSTVAQLQELVEEAQHAGFLATVFPSPARLVNHAVTHPASPNCIPNCIRRGVT